MADPTPDRSDLPERATEPTDAVTGDRPESGSTPPLDDGSPAVPHHVASEAPTASEGSEDGAGAADEGGRTQRRLTDGIKALDPSNAGPGAAAFFDVDNTLMKGSSFGELARGMADRDYFTTSEIIEFSWKQLKFVLSGKENMEDIAAATENGLAFVKGRSTQEIRDLAAQVYDERMVKRLWGGTVELAEAHQALGHEVWLISATPVEVSEVIAAELGLTGGLGTRAEVVDGVYTGHLDGPPLHGPAKSAQVQQLAVEHGLDLARCAAYSDSSNDIPMLSIVGFPVAVNPDGRLRAHAREHGWPIRDYRIRGNPAVRKGVPAAAAAGAAVGVAVGVAKAISVIREGQTGGS